MNQNYLNLIELYRKANNNTTQSLKYYVAADGLSKGNMDATIYDQFENYVPRKLDTNNPKIMLMAYNFALIDLQLYLDVHPEDVVSKELFDKYLEEYIKTKRQYESISGPITLDSSFNLGNAWKWQKNWPFAGGDK